MFLIAAIYFIAVAALGEGSAYTVVGAVLCLIAIGLAVGPKLVVASPWRAASAAFCVVIFLAQIMANGHSNSAANIYTVSSTILNGALLILLAGVLLSTSRDMMKKPGEEEEEEEKKPAKKITYQI
jgi:uncharacterized membrane protein